MSTQITALRPGSWPRSDSTLAHRSVPGKGARVTSNSESEAWISSAICSASSSGLIALTIPAASPPQMVKWVCGRLGSRNDTALPGRRPRR
ncbi:hypothetical protein D3C72_2083240 [compost metagenome]